MAAKTKPKARRRPQSPSPPPWDERVKDMAIKISAVSAACAALAGGYLWLGLPKVATSADIKRLDSNQAQIAVDVYAKDVRDQIILRNSVKNDPTALRMVDENIAEAKEKLKAAQDRRIELGK